MNNNLNKILTQMKKWVKEVGGIQHERIRESNFQIKTKSSSIDLVTEIDKLSEKIIIDKIEKNYPEHSILCEEQGEFNKNSNYTWIIDPLDGTNNYAHGYPLYGISIGLQYKSEMQIGVVYIPELKEMFSAVKNNGSYLNGEKLKVSNRKKLGNCLVSTGFPYDKLSSQVNNIKHFNKILMKARGIRRSGSAAFDLSNVAAGRIDGFWEFKLKPWDIAAGKLFVQEAGGKIIETQINNNIPLIIAGNEEICDTLYDILTKVNMSY